MSRKALKNAKVEAFLNSCQQKGFYFKTERAD